MILSNPTKPLIPLQDTHCHILYCVSNFEAHVLQLIHPTMSSALASCPTMVLCLPALAYKSWLWSPSQPEYFSLHTPSPSSHAHPTYAHFQHGSCTQSSRLSLLPLPGLRCICRTRLIIPTFWILPSNSSNIRRGVSFWWEIIRRWDSQIMQLTFLSAQHCLPVHFHYAGPDVMCIWSLRRG